ncbi:MAG: hypothetical protein R2878_04440 [Thermoleophilia bacterium]
MTSRTTTDLITLAAAVVAAAAGLLVVVAAGGRTGAGLTVGVIAMAVVIVSRLAVERLSLGKNRPESGVSQDS